ncbi:MAG: threonine synthase [Gammaproteobacteria bacterium]|jgi:threonine synthase|nr:threonine synthase [Gammaproteobacteria bacterium]MDP6616522.1 threonine synthase [Gammaproteobacteria bacterium]MDP6694229.1 threonine synthase [Gammaproteobacteria bacterium]MDP7041094.1 threonine synthase [Gammaproteobacteria bacterium]
MNYQSTRGGAPVALEDAIMSGTAPDGGLFVPVELPHFDPADMPAHVPIRELAQLVLKPFFDGSELSGELDEICADAFTFAAPLRQIETGKQKLSVLELFHGPTAAFKDFGARFLAATMSRIIRRRDDTRPATIVVATSGDTGGAVAAAFHQRPGTRVVVLFPDGRVSPRQEHQLTCWGDNIISLAVKGEFDDCQRLAKALFADAAISAEHNLCSANSINVGRLLPQSVYYAQSSLDYLAANGEPSNYIVPTGNLGNAFACAWAKQMGFPVADMILATNANRTIPDYLDSGNWEPRSSVATLASAMDVGDPSNMERLRQLWGDADALREKLRSFSVSDDEIREQIRTEFARSGLICCPHTATGFHVYRNLLAQERKGNHWIIVATAHAAKFDDIVEPLVGEAIPVPDELARILEWPSHFDTIEPDISEITARL